MVVWFVGSTGMEKDYHKGTKNTKPDNCELRNPNLEFGNPKFLFFVFFVPLW
jgi:hypothetical protein